MAMTVTQDLVVHRPQGLYCPAGDFYIDPWRPVEHAVITHAHADHARSGHAHYLAAEPGLGLLRSRLGGVHLQGLAYGEVLVRHGVRVSLHPAGHVLGSAQVRIEHGGQVWVVSGDYFVSGAGDANPTCAAFEPQRCDCFITESTFGLPVFRWRTQAQVMAEVNAWWQGNAANGKCSLLLGYSLGKAQRLLAGLEAGIGPIGVHPAVAALNEVYRAQGVALPPTCTLAAGSPWPERSELARALVLAPPAVQGSAWAQRLGPRSEAFASGWMALRGRRRREGLDRGFVLSDHADWPGLQQAIRATGAQRVLVTHGYEAVMVRYLSEQGLQADSMRTAFGEAFGGEEGHEPAAEATDAISSTP
jgi:putative mRNA 3-end processing factor